MKKIILFIALIIGVTICSSCSDDYEDKYDNQAKFFVKEISRLRISAKYGNNTTYIPLKYDSKGRVIEFEDYFFSYEGNTVKYSTKQGELNYTFTLNKDGFITKGYGRWLYPNRWDENTEDTFTYDSFGRLTRIDQKKIHHSFSTGTDRLYYDSWSIKWENGNIVEIIQTELLDESDVPPLKHTFRFTFTYNDDTIVNNMNINPIWFIDGGCLYSDYNYPLAVFGFLGKFSKNLPTSWTEPNEMNTVINTREFSYEFNPDGSIAAIHDYLSDEPEAHIVYSFKY